MARDCLWPDPHAQILIEDLQYASPQDHVQGPSASSWGMPPQDYSVLRDNHIPYPHENIPLLEICTLRERILDVLFFFLFSSSTFLKIGWIWCLMLPSVHLDTSMFHLFLRNLPMLFRSLVSRSGSLGWKIGVSSSAAAVPQPPRAELHAFNTDW